MEANILSDRVQFISKAETVTFRGLDMLSGNVQNTSVPPSSTVRPTVRIILAPEMLAAYPSGYYDVDLRVITNQPTWTEKPSTEGAFNCLEDLTPLFRKEPSGSGGGQVDTIVAGDAIDVDSTDPANPIVGVKVDGITVTINGSNELEAAAGAGITALTGDVTATGPGSAAATIAANAVSNTKLADMAQATFKLRAAGAGTGDPIDGTPNQASTILDGATDPFARTSAIPAAGITSLTGPVTAGPGSGSQVSIITPVIAAAGPVGSATVSAIITFNAAGQLTTVTSATITPAIGSITGLGANVATALANAVGSAGAIVVFNGAGGTPSSIVLTNATGLPIAGLTGLGTGVATALAIAVGSAGAFVTFNGAGGTPSSITLTNGVSLPLSTGISGFGTGIATALAVNVGTAGAPVINGGALGTPSSGTLTNATNLPPSTGLTSPYGAFVVASYNLGRTISLGGIVTLTNQANALAFLSVVVVGPRLDLTGFTEIKFQIGVTTASASVNTPKVILRYFTSYSTTTTDYLDIGTSEVSVSMSAAGIPETAWIPLAAGAIGANKYLRMLVSGGDGAADPVVSFGTAFVR